MGERRYHALATLALGLAMLTAGCIGMTDDQATDQPLDTLTQGRGDSDDQMSADEETSQEEGVEPTQVPPFYARKTITVSGDLTLETLPAILATVNGEITVEPGPEDAWKLVATLTGRGQSPEDAREQRDRMTFLWSIGPAGDHALAAQVTVKDDPSDDGPITIGSSGHAEGDLALTVPEDLVLDLKAHATNGAIEVSGLDTDELTIDTTNAKVRVSDVTAEVLSVDTTNGDIDVEASGTREVVLDTTNAQITATITPADDGTIEVDTTNGAVDLRVPEDGQHGYDATADTTNGQITIELQDGETSYDEDREDARFRTNGYDGRGIQTQITMDSTNGDMTLGPA